MEEFAIPEEYFSCHADRLFDLLADSLVTFAKRYGFRWAPAPALHGAKGFQDRTRHSTAVVYHERALVQARAQRLEF